MTAATPCKVQLELSENEAHVLALMVKRMGYHDALKLSSRYDFYDEEAEVDVMLAAIVKLQRALREAGHQPR